MNLSLLPLYTIKFSVASWINIRVRVMILFLTLFITKCVLVKVFYFEKEIVSVLVFHLDIENDLVRDEEMASL